MAMPIIITFLAAIVLGQRFKVLVLLPASIIAGVATVGAGLVEELNGWSIACEVLLVLTAVQVGYLVGTATQHFTAPQDQGPIAGRIYMACTDDWPVAFEPAGLAGIEVRFRPPDRRKGTAHNP
jgi:hypothetical protein